MAVRSKQLWAPTAVGVADVVLYTCPAGETALLKCLTFVNNAAVSTSIVVRLNAANNSAAFVERLIDNNNGLVLNDIFVVLHPGDTVHAIAGLASVVVGGFGAELEGLAD